MELILKKLKVTMKTIIALYVCEILVIQTFCSLLQQTTYLPVGTEYPCENTSDIVMQLDPALRFWRAISVYVKFNKKIYVNSTVKIQFDSNVWITFIDENAEWGSMDLPMGISLTRQFLNPQQSFSFIAAKKVPQYPNLISFVINDKEYCVNPNKGMFNKYMTSRNLTKYKNTINYTSKYTKKKKCKTDIHCGRRKINTKSVTDPKSGVDLPQDTGFVVNGLANPGEWPWHAAVYRKDFILQAICASEKRFAKRPRHVCESDFREFVCGGTLISHNFVLTSEECTFEQEDSIMYSVALGRHLLWSENDKAVVVDVEKVFAKSYALDDISLLKLKRQVQFTKNIRPACLWHRREVDLPGDRVVGILVGWGYTNGDRIIQRLQQVNLPMVSKSTCMESNPSEYKKYLNERTFCAGYHNNGTAPCNGDTGGAFQVFIPDNIKNKRGIVSGAWYVRGIMTYSMYTISGDCDENQYAVFVEEDKFADWIDSHLDD